MTPRPELWKSIAGFPNYVVSTHGRVRSLARVVQHGYGHNATTNKGESILKPCLLYGRRRVVLYNGIGASKNANYEDLAGLVLTTFVCSRPWGRKSTIAWFLDEDRENCHVENLTWVRRAYLLAINRGYQPKVPLEDYVKEYSYRE